MDGRFRDGIHLTQDHPHQRADVIGSMRLLHGAFSCGVALTLLPAALPYSRGVGRLSRSAAHTHLLSRSTGACNRYHAADDSHVAQSRGMASELGAELARVVL